MPDFETVLNKLGPCGQYQMLLYTGCFASVAIAGAAMNLIIVFYASTPDHWCRNPSVGHLNLTREVLLNLTIPKEYNDGDETYSHCRKYDIDFSNWTRDDVEQALREKDLQSSLNVTECTLGWQYHFTAVASSIVSDWDLVCENRVLVDVVKSVYQLGFGFGVLGFSFIADSYGRRPAFISSLIMKLVCAIGSAFSPNYTVFVVLRFFLGCAALGNYVVGFILVSEMISSRTRTKLAPVPSYMWGTTLMAVAGLAYIFREWRHLALAVSLPQLIMLPVCWFVPESPRWLYVKNRHTEADATMRKIAKFNGVSLPGELDVEITVSASKGVLKDILHSQKLRCFVIIVSIGWMMTSMVYYFISLYSADFGGDLYINFLIGGAVEILAALLGQVVVVFIGRRTILGSGMVVVGISVFCIMFVPKDLSWISVTLAMVGRFGLLLVYIAKLTFLAELFPTAVRNVGMSICQAASRIGGITSAYVGSLLAVNRYLAFGLLGVMCVTAGLLQFLLPETKDKKMLQTVADAEEVYKYRSPRSICCSNSTERRRRVDERGEHVLVDPVAKDGAI